MAIRRPASRTAAVGVAGSGAGTPRPGPDTALRACPSDTRELPRGKAHSAPSSAPARHRGFPQARSDGRGRRIRGIDAARALAIVGMVAVHFGPTGVQAAGVAGRLYSLSHGRAVILFALLAGIGVTLLAGDRSPDRRRQAWAQLGMRAALLLPLGLALQMLDHGVLVVLQYYALFFVAAGAALRLSDRLLLSGALAAAVLAPVVYVAAWQRRPSWFERDAATLAASPAEIIRDLLLSGSYPAVTYAAPVLFGMWLGRRALRSPVVRATMLAGGAAVAVGAWALSGSLQAWVRPEAGDPSWRLLVVDHPHSQMPLWLIGATAAATAVLGLSLLAVERAPRLTWPLVASGQLALTLYVGHLLVLAAWPWLLRRDDVLSACLTVAAFSAVVALVAVAWRAAFSRGPLEALLRLPWSMGRRRA